MYAGLLQLLVPDQGVDLSDVGTCYAEGCSGEQYCNVRVGKKQVLRVANAVRRNTLLHNSNIR